MSRLVGLSVVLGSTLGLAGSVAAQAQLPKLVLWWNDPVIAEPLGITDEQREKMNQAFSDYEKVAGPARRKSVTRKPYLVALENGNWELAKTEAERWLESDQVPKRAMVELKLAVLPILSADQRSRLVAQYPRLVRRPWNPAPKWDQELRLRNRPPASSKGAEPKKP